MPLLSRPHDQKDCHAQKVKALQQNTKDSDSVSWYVTLGVCALCSIFK